MPPIFQQKSSVVALVLLLTGVIFHIRGTVFSSGTQAEVEQIAGLLFDLLSGNILWALQLHLNNKQAIQQVSAGATPQAVVGTVNTASGLVGQNIAKGLLFFLACTVLSGCASFGQLSDPDKLAQVEASFTAAVTTLTDLRQAGVIGEQDYHNIVGVEQTISKALDQVHADLKAGGKLDGNEAWTVINSGLNQVLVYKWRFTTNGTNHSGGSNGPTTTPATHQSALQQWRADDPGAAGLHRAAA